jgi:hypothetical protein
MSKEELLSKAKKGMQDVLTDAESLSELLDDLNIGSIDTAGLIEKWSFLVVSMKVLDDYVDELLNEVF